MSSVQDRKIRVFQVATGNVGSEMIKRITRHPDLELIGLHCYSPDKIGRDAGEIVGLAPIGVTATRDFDFGASPSTATMSKCAMVPQTIGSSRMLSGVAPTT